MAAPGRRWLIAAVGLLNMGAGRLLATTIAMFGLISLGMIVGATLVYLKFRGVPSNDKLKLAILYQRNRGDDYKALCFDARTQAEALALLAATIHANNPSEASAKIVVALERFIANISGRLSAKTPTPADGAPECF